MTAVADTSIVKAPVATSLPSAAGAGEVPVSDGAGTDYTATPRSDVVTAALVSMIGGEPAGSALIPDGLGGMRVVDPSVAPALAATSAAAALAAWGGAAAPTVYYADDFTAEAGSESASVTGTDAASTLTLTAGSTARTYGTAGATAARVVLPIPAGAREIEVEIQVTAVSGMTGTGQRHLTIALRNTANGGAPATLWGISLNDSSGGFYANNLMGGGNSGNPSGSTAHAPTSVDKWFRVQLKPREAFLTFTTGAGSAGARPSTWSAPGTAVPLQVNANSVVYPDLGSATAIAIVLQSMGSGGATSITCKATVRVVSQ